MTISQCAISVNSTECMGHSQMSLVVRKPAFCICEYKDADQLRGGFVFATRIVQSLFLLNPKFHAFVSNQVGNPEDRFSHNEAQIKLHYFSAYFWNTPCINQIKSLAFSLHCGNIANVKHSTFAWLFTILPPCLEVGGGGGGGRIINI